jgi:hypothetical protein
MKLVIHAGIHRTGTSSLQQFLHRNRAALAAHGIAYPGSEANHQKAAWALRRNPANPESLGPLLDPCASSQLAILSGEDFCIHEDLSWLETLAERHEVRVVFYLRRQDHWVMSWYNQHIKWPFDREKSRMSKEEFLAAVGDFHWLDFATMLRRWSNVLGMDAVSVGVVERGQVEDVIADFIARAGLPAEGLEPTEGRFNDSLPVHLLEVARHLGIHDLPGKARVRLLAAMRGSLANKRSPANTILSPQERNTLLARFEASNRIAALEFLGRAELFYELPPGAQDPYFDFPELSSEELLREWVRPLIHALAKP